MIRAKVEGRNELFRRLAEIAPSVEKYATEAKLKAGDELADAIRARAPTGATLEYMESIQADLVSSRPHQERISQKVKNDPTAVGLFAEFIWRFLEFGTAPHNTAKGGGTALGWAQFRAGDGSRHPGTAAQPQICPTWRERRAKIKRSISLAVSRGVREAMRK